MLAIGASGGGLAGAWWWAFDLAAHFRVQYFACLALGAIVLGLLRRFRWAAVCGLFALGNAAIIAPLYWGGVTAVESSNWSCRLLLVNVSTSNTQYDQVRQLVDEVDPDVLVLLEVDDAWMEGMAGLQDRLPHRISRPRDDNFGIVLWSRHPPRRGGVQVFGTAGVPSIVCALGGEESPFTLIATHPVPPRWREGARLRNDQLEALAGVVNGQAGPVVVLGDLNATPFSAHFRALLESTGLRNSARGYGLQPTWPADFWPLRIPIDHCLVSPGVAVTRREIGPDIGSDHFPLIVELAIPIP